MDHPHDEGEASRLPEGLRRSLAADTTTLDEEGLTADVGDLDEAGARWLHDELLRLGAGEPDAPDHHRLLLAVVRRDLVARRRTRDAAAIQAPIGNEPPKEEPARRRILATLRTGPAIGTDLANNLSLARETVTRILSALAADGYVSSVSDPHDKRRKIYSLEPAGLDLLVQSESALGVAAPAAIITPEVEGEYLKSSTQRAVELRRLRYDLPHAEERLRSIVQNAPHFGRPDIEVMARRELITTLRHDGRWGEAKEQISLLEDLAISGRIQASCVAPALAHVGYEQGRLPSAVGSPLPERAWKLTGVVGDFERLAKADPNGVEDWTIRAAWAMTGLAEVLREQTEFGKAIFQAKEAEQLFRDRQDRYGLARALFLQGFCDRLRGKYGRARTTLLQALELALELGSQRWEAHARMQLGDVSRCLERYDDADAYLTAALELTSTMPMALTRAFTLSALGATRYATKDYPAASKLLGEAHELFAERNHSEGLALNTRRQAVAFRAIERPDLALDSALDAYHSYRSVQSPAGIAASLVEIIEDRLLLDLDIGGAVTTLGRYMVRPSPRRLIELDPSTPQLVDELVRRLEADKLPPADRALTEESARLLQTAKDRLAENYEREDDILDGLDDEGAMGRVADGRGADRPGPHPAAVQWDWFDDDDPESSQIYDRQNIMGVEPRREAERQIAA